MFRYNPRMWGVEMNSYADFKELFSPEKMSGIIVELCTSFRLIIKQVMSLKVQPLKSLLAVSYKTNVLYLCVANKTRNSRAERRKDVKVFGIG